VIVAFCAEGPLGGVQFAIGARNTPDLIYVAPTPEGVTGPIDGEWMLVGTDLIPPEHPWPGQIAYELDRIASLLRPHPTYEGMEEGTAIYAWVDE